ncbi:hypothetical protein VSR34_19810 [Paraburkholderia sp. JHI2823]|uniref:hypothetical protein n=1 Tax=Paraburkholderia TaxID=1822464 RepID=UPI00041D90F4|nr:hypothetical protein [Paraburkholderia mimosarum]
MYRSYEYGGFTLEVSVDVDAVRIGPVREAQAVPVYVAVVRISRDGHAMAIFSPLSFGVPRGSPFSSEIDALMGGYSAGRKIVDDFFH